MDIVSLKKSTRKPRLVNQSSAIANDIYQLTGQDDRNKSAKEEKITKRKLSLEHRKKYPVSNGEILRFLSLKKEQSRLKKIFDGEISSERHDILRQMFKTGKLNFGIYAPITRLAQIDFLEDDKKIDSKLFNLLEPILKQWDLSSVPEMAFSKDELPYSQSKSYRQKYIHNVMVPESIVRYLQRKNGWDKNKAEDFFQDGESRVTQNELNDLDKELEIDAKREKERKLQEQSDDSNDSENDLSYDLDEEFLELPNIDDDANSVTSQEVEKSSIHQKCNPTKRVMRKKRSFKKSD